MPLALASLGEIRTIVGFIGKDEIRKHLNNLGFIKGEQVQILGENQSGMIVLVKDVRVALNKGLMSKIMVE
ncbi:ferrous iron transport protein A [Niameybacter massiliensis]|uniref:Ferrous iron transport protein A n=1 Tax=Holtiella tumoricola TaxID=3018743 RepID=A0AA42J099_9FIRM|nr:MULTISPECIES: ferrous iron transport protein A [Lachnospirales]MDA3731026.1 ferrous iron transport protein A [Holtiella tumoricola]